MYVRLFNVRIVLGTLLAVVLLFYSYYRIELRKSIPLSFSTYFIICFVPALSTYPRWSRSFARLPPELYTRSSSLAFIQFWFQMRRSTFMCVWSSSLFITRTHFMGLESSECSTKITFGTKRLRTKEKIDISERVKNSNPKVLF